MPTKKDRTGAMPFSGMEKSSLADTEGSMVKVFIRWRREHVLSCSVLCRKPARPRVKTAKVVCRCNV